MNANSENVNFGVKKHIVDKVNSVELINVLDKNFKKSKNAYYN